MIKEYIPHGFNSWYSYNRHNETVAAIKANVIGSLRLAVITVSCGAIGFATIWAGCFLDFITK